MTYGWTVSNKNFKKLEKLRPKGRQQNIVIEALLRLAAKHGLTKEQVDEISL